jgi:hypothetical protein
LLYVTGAFRHRLGGALELRKAIPRFLCRADKWAVRRDHIFRADRDDGARMLDPTHATEAA